LQLSFGGNVPDALKPGTLESGTAKPFVLEDPLPRDVIVMFLAKAISAAVWLAMVCSSSFCCVGETRA
jgi:hypothetical protein